MRVAIMMRGNANDKDRVLERFDDLVSALQATHHEVVPVVYSEAADESVRGTLLTTDLALVWVNPIDAGRDRSHLDGLLREIASAGVVVSSHPDIILKLGTKRVLYETRAIGWGTDTNLYETAGELAAGLATSLIGGARVLKQHRGSSGLGVWSVELADPTGRIDETSVLRVRHAQRGSEDELVSFNEFCGRCEPYFDAGLIIDQQFQARLADGMIRCYLVHGQVAGFGHQETNALIPAAAGTTPPTPTTREYFPATKPEFQSLKGQLESDWIPAVLDHFGLDLRDLPLLWDCDFLLGPPTNDGEDTYVLCEINVSSVAPYPASVVPAMIAAIG